MQIATNWAAQGQDLTTCYFLMLQNVPWILFYKKENTFPKQMEYFFYL